MTKTKQNKTREIDKSIEVSSGCHSEEFFRTRVKV